MKLPPAALLAIALALGAQQRPPAASPAEQADLETALAEAGGSPIEYLRAIEKHLEKYPDSPRRGELERAAVRAAMELNDDDRIVRYGERVLARQPDDLSMLDRVTRSLLVSDSKDNAERALKYARRYETIVDTRKGERNELDRGIGLALREEARATGNLGRSEEALALAGRSFDTFPDAESARERARWLELLGRPGDAVAALADAFTIPDPRATDADRARDRGRMGELYSKWKGSEAGLGELVLGAYDRNLALIHARELRLRVNDPNSGVTDPMEFMLGGPDGAKLAMASLKGKVVILDFWATWCGPCRAQHPLYEEVKQRFRDNPDVVFLSVNSDEDRAAVKPFLDEVKWQGGVYFEDGLSRALNVRSIPTTIVIDRQGKISSRMNGYVPERFVEMLAERIQEAR
jgi:thiol-disulfide isomerase/thioredoxin